MCVPVRVRTVPILVVHVMTFSIGLCSGQRVSPADDRESAVEISSGLVPIEELLVRMRLIPRKMPAAPPTEIAIAHRKLVFMMPPELAIEPSIKPLRGPNHQYFDVHWESGVYTPSHLSKH
jgi:hypothetical protein